MSRSTHVGLWIFAALLATAVAGLGLSLSGLQEEGFPHARHEGLFPLCTGCHEGVPSADTAAFYPEPGSCDGCHDGVGRARVTWTGPARASSNVVFDHSEHAALLAAGGDPAPSCASCHNEPGGGRMGVADSIQLGTCWSCHAHEARSHFQDADCAVCHEPLSDTGFGARRVADLPTPADHLTGAFLPEDHGTAAERDVGRCATCHTRERCVACHVDTDRASIEAMPSAGPGLELPPAVVHYNRPATHVDAGWFSEHPLQASRAQCATCHTSDDCAACHVQPLPEVARSLPSRREAIAPGVGLTVRAPESHGRAFFMQAHPTLAAADERSCAVCHRESFCVDCHDAPMGGGYHPPSFMSRHAADAFGRDTDCSNCHNAQVFCRECHVQAGLVATGGRLSEGYHVGGSLWLLRHGQAARQNLESCASCHKQLDCTQCHGVLGAFQVSPHGADFDAARGWARSPRACLGCHIGNPLNGREP